MANYSKSFNFRNGVQVDDDNLVVDTLGKVGIGTSVPSEFLDVRGNAVVSGFTTASDVYSKNIRITGIITASTLTDGKVTISSGIVTASSGVVTYYGDGGKLSNLPTSQWIDTDVGLGFTSIYANGFVGVSTNDPRFSFQVAGNNTVNSFSGGVGINSGGDILATGIITASTVRAALAATFLTGTIDNGRLPSNISVSGIVTATGGFVGSLTGTATTAQFLTGSPNIVVGIVTASSVNSAGLVTATGVTLTNNAVIGGFASIGSTVSIGSSVTIGGNITVSSGGITVSGDASISGNSNVTGILTAANIKSGLSTTGISTVHTSFHVGTSGTFFAVTSDGKIGIGTGVPTSDVQIRRPSASFVEVLSDTGSARISIGQSVNAGKSTGIIRFGSSPNDLEVVNNDNDGDFNFIINGNGFSGSNRFSWLNGYGNQELMFLTHDAKLGIGITNPSSNLHVVGNSNVTGNALFGNNVNVTGILTATTLSISNLSGTLQGNVNSTSGVSTFANVIVSSGSSLGIGTETPISGIDARTQTGLFGALGVGTDTFYGSEVLSVVGSVTIPDGGVGIGTTYIDPAGAALQLYAPLIDLDDGHLNIKFNSTVGFNTLSPRAIFDFGTVGSATTRPVLVVPNISTSTRNGIGGTPAGSTILNTTTSEFQGYVNNSWNSLGIQTSVINSNQINVSGVVTAAQIKVGTGVTINSGIVTATNGFLSGVGTAVQITTVGNKVVFTVPGVGTTSLTLF